MRELRNSSVEKKAVDIKTRGEARRQRANGQDLLAAPRPYIPTRMPNRRLAGPYALQRVRGAYIKCHEKDKPSQTQQWGKPILGSERAFEPASTPPSGTRRSRVKKKN